MAAVIAHEFGEASSQPLHRAALIGLAVLLFAFTLLVNVAARWFTARADRKAAL
jgi:ABC-type phosphate transport system permease subunit